MTAPDSSSRLVRRKPRNHWTAAHAALMSGATKGRLGMRHGHRQGIFAAATFTLATAGCSSNPTTPNTDHTGGSAGTLDGGAGTGGETSRPEAGERTEHASCDDSTDGADACTACTGQGWVAGSNEGTTCVYRGIPYAEAPIGDKRWTAPEPAAGWAGVRDATEFGAACIQGLDLSATDDKSEDCLFLNVWTPADGNAGPLPVMVFIHGGGYSGGATNPHDGRGLSEAGPVVVVSMNYRIGVLGFLAHPDLDAERADTPSGSDGIRDQQLALAWVHDNIAAFGGDPSNVTLFGESAGSSSVGVHQVSPGSAGLAHRFIMESGVSTSGVANGIEPISRDEAYVLATELQAALCPDATDALACLRALPPEQLMQWRSATATGNAQFVPVIEGPGGVLPEHPDALIASGDYNAGPVLVGTNRNEYGLFQGGSGPDTVSELEADVSARFGNRADAILELYRPDTDGEASQAQITMMTDIMFRCATRRFARAIAAQDTPVFLYSFEQGAAIHADELGYVFGPGYYQLSLVQPNPDLSAAMQAYWTEFARSGDPNQSEFPEWPRYDASEDAHMVLTDPLSTGTGLQRETCDFWDEYLEEAGP